MLQLAIKMTYLELEPLGELLGLVVSEGVACVGDENGGHPESTLLVHQLLEAVGGERQHLFAAHDHAVDVEQQPELGHLQHARPDSHIAAHFSRHFENLVVPAGG